MSEYFYLEQWYRWLRENLQFILMGILLLLFVIGYCCSCYIAGANANEGAER